MMNKHEIPATVLAAKVKYGRSVVKDVGEFDATILADINRSLLAPSPMGRLHQRLCSYRLDTFCQGDFPVNFLPTAALTLG
jgi:hypothetical protein